MLKFFVLLALVYCAAAETTDWLQDQEVRPDGFKHVLALQNGIEQFAEGKEDGSIEGSYSYVSPEGTKIEVKYVANENGYQPTSDVLPTPPPVPEAILKALEYLRTHEPKDEIIRVYT